MSAEPTQIEAVIADLVRKRLPKKVESVGVETAENEEGDDYLLVSVRLTSADVDDEVLERLLEDIEAAVARLDERYPSVRFLDAA